MYNSKLYADRDQSKRNYEFYIFFKNTDIIRYFKEQTAKDDL